MEDAVSGGNPTEQPTGGSATPSTIQIDDLRAGSNVFDVKVDASLADKAAADQLNSAPGVSMAKSKDSLAPTDLPPSESNVAEAQS